jgi:acyl-CoA thioesterase-2
VTEVDILELLSLTPSGEDRFTHPGREPLGPFTGMFGGQPLALALRAAGLTVAGDRLPHSLHAYFLRPGTSVEPLDIKVDRDTDGRSFSARRVTVSQSEGVILNLSASFHVSEEGPDLQERHPPEGLADPDTLPSRDSMPFSRHIAVVDVREVGSRVGAMIPDLAWGRAAGPLPEDPLLHACVLVYFSDLFSALPPKPGTMDSGGPSLDHAFWFLREAKMDDWVLMDLRPVAASGGRGLYSGEFFDRAGRQIASLRQEILYSTSRPPRMPPPGIELAEKLPPPHGRP